jgi:hypothetical protein
MKHIAVYKIYTIKKIYLDFINNQVCPINVFTCGLSNWKFKCGQFHQVTISTFFKHGLLIKKKKTVFDLRIPLV